MTAGKVICPSWKTCKTRATAGPGHHCKPHYKQKTCDYECHEGTKCVYITENDELMDTMDRMVKEIEI